METVRKVPVALIAALVVQTIGGLVWAGGAAARIGTLEQRVGEQRLVAERLARLIVPDFGQLEGPFVVAALEYAGAHEGEATFAISLASAGELAFEAL